MLRSLRGWMLSFNLNTWVHDPAWYLSRFNKEFRRLPPEPSRRSPWIYDHDDPHFHEEYMIGRQDKNEKATVRRPLENYHASLFRYYARNLAVFQIRRWSPQGCVAYMQPNTRSSILLDGENQRHFGRSTYRWPSAV